MKNEFEFLKDEYKSPRWSGEYFDCSMPMTFDTYSNCGFGCLYCFATFQRGNGQSGKIYKTKQVKKIKFEKIERMFKDPDKYGGQFKEYIKNKMVLQWGGLSDPMCPIEEEGGVGLKLLKLFNELEYPVRFSSKSDLILRDHRYLDEFAKGANHYAYMSSIITYDPEIAAKLEARTPTPQRRMQVLKTLTDVGVWTIIRLRPYIVGITDKTVKDIINEGGKAGVKALSTEALCVDQRMNDLAKAKFKKLSELCGFDVIDFYKKHSNTIGYMRLSREFLRPYMDEIIHLCADNNIKLAVSCPKHKEKTFGYSCCGLPMEGPLGNTHKGQFMYAIMIAREKGIVKWSDIEKHMIFKDIERVNATGINKCNGKKQASLRGLTLSDMLHAAWNDTKKSNNPYKLFEGVLLPNGIDENGDIIYRYNPYA